MALEKCSQKELMIQHRLDVGDTKTLTKIESNTKDDQYERDNIALEERIRTLCNQVDLKRINRSLFVKHQTIGYRIDTNN